jgi:hypothetical protein
MQEERRRKERNRSKKKGNADKEKKKRGLFASVAKQEGTRKKGNEPM